MKKRDVTAYMHNHQKTAEYIVAHARWQRSRGRHPSESYKGMRNPAEALVVAINELRYYKPMAGENILFTAGQMVKIVALTKKPCVAYFNNVRIDVDQNTSVDDVVRKFSLDLEREAEEYRRSPSGKQAERQAEERRQEAQSKADNLVAKLPQLDFGCFHSVIDWLEELQDPSDYVGVLTPWREIVEMFRQQGFYPGVNCNDAFNAEDEENFARWLIGQALDNLSCEVHAIHQVYHRFADDWRRKFVRVV